MTRLDANPLRVLDCKRAECRAATADVPRLIDHLCEDCAAHFARVRAGLDALGVAYVIDHRLVRGFDYYTRTTFEFASGAIEAAQDAIGGGGRYDGLVEMLGGPPTPGIGFGIGHREGAHRLRRRRGLPGRRPRPPMPSWWTWPAGRRPATWWPRCAGRACGPTGPTTAGA